MKKILPFLLFFFVFSLGAQTVFLPNIGTKWNYLYGSRGNFYTKMNSTIEYKRDSISTSTGETIKILQIGRLFTECNPSVSKWAFIKQKNDSIWFWHSAGTDSTWQLLINYNALPNQSWTLTVNNGAVRTYTVKVKAVTTETIKYMPLKKLSVDYTHTNREYSFAGTIYERFGDFNGLFPFDYRSPMSVCDADYLQNFLCYQDSTFGLKQFTNFGCEYSDWLSVNETPFDNPGFDIFPIPTNDQLTINVPEITLNQIRIYNSTGQMIRTEGLVLENGKAQVKTEELANGIYFIQLFGTNSSSGFRKFVVKH